MRDYAKINFYSELKRNDTMLNDVFTFIEEKGEESGFYELCCKFLDITLNAPKFKDGTAILQYSDVDIAVNATETYIREHNIDDIYSLLNLIYEYHPKAHRMNETRSSNGIVWSESSSAFGRIGKYYDFSKIPSENWEEIKKQIFEKVKA